MDDAATPIEPDTKDWTWVLERPCPDCGFDGPALPADQVGTLVRQTLPRWEAVLRRDDVARRPAPSTWSPLEYACHMRDVFAVMGGRLELVLTRDDPVFPSWDQDESAVSDRYGEQDPADVARELVANGTTFAAAFEAVPAADRDRPGRRSDGAAFTVTTLGRYVAHELVHHTWDVRG